MRIELLNSLTRNTSLAGSSISAWRCAWGTRLADDNAKKLSGKTDKNVDKLYQKMVPAYALKKDATTEEKVEEIFHPNNWSLLLIDEKTNRLRFEIAVGGGKGSSTPVCVNVAV